MSTRPLVPVLLAVAAGTLAVAVLGPAGVGLLEHRTSSSGESQLVGADAVGVLVVVPVCLLVAVLAWRGHRAAPALALAPSGYATYTFTQVLLGQEHLQQPGNVERFFPLLLVLAVVGGVGLVLAWSGTTDLPPVPPRLERAAGVVLLLLAVFLVVGLHLPTLLDAMSAEPQRAEYLAAPTAFWVIKVMDLGILVPVAVATGVGLLRHRPWARRPMYAVLGTYTLVGTSVVAMAVVMLWRDEAGASLGLALGLAGFAAVLWGLTIALYRPLFAATGPTRGPASPDGLDIEVLADPASPVRSSAPR